MKAAHAVVLLAAVSGFVMNPLPAGAKAEEYPMDQYNVVWDTPSRDSSGSMPLGNGDVGVNAWVEENGDLLFYVSKTDAWSENARLLKLGRVRLALSPSLFVEGARFKQTLDLRHGCIDIEGSGATLKLWVDANAPVVRIEVETPRPAEATVALERWRTEARALTGDERFSAYGLMKSPDPVVVSPDAVLSGETDRIVWYHRNERSIWGQTLRHQGMEAWIAEAADPLEHRTFGGLIEGDGLAGSDAATLKSKEPAKRFRVAVHCLTAQTETPGQWRDQLADLSAETRRVDWGEAYEAHCAWWRGFWDRSWIHVTGAPDAEAVSRGYALQRFITACAGRGAHPIKFNGSIFTVDSREPGKPFDADYRNWGGPYWFQNTRLVYWPMPAAGDFDLMRPLFRMFRDALPFAQARAKVYFGHDGAFFPETIYFWGAYAMDNYGWERSGKPASHVDNTYIRHYFSNALELLALMLDYYAFTRETDFARATLVPMADAVLTFYDRHYARDDAGHIRFEPAQSLETWHQAVNPLPEIAGLRFVIDGLCALSGDIVDEGRRAGWQRLRAELPPMPTRDVAGERVLAPAAELIGGKSNSENPELYAVFPYRVYGVGKPDIELARRTFDHREVKGHNGWRQDDTQAAFLGLAATAREYVAKRFAEKHPGSRFPAFWGPNFDWIPDQDHGGNGLKALQTMLVQADGRTIRLFPAWPKAWDIDFKLHAPFKTTIRGTMRDGQLLTLEVDPPERRQDVTLLSPQGD